jgi:hypothetical protein
VEQTIINLEYCDCGAKALNLVGHQVDDFWEAHEDCYSEFEYVKPKGTISDSCICGDSIESFPDHWYEMWVDVHNEHSTIDKQTH